MRKEDEKERRADLEAHKMVKISPDDSHGPPVFVAPGCRKDHGSIVKVKCRA